MKNNFKIPSFLFVVFVSIYSDPVSIDSICRKPEITDVSLSMDGKYVAGIYTNIKDQQQLFTHAIDTKERKILKPESDENDVYNYDWASNTRLVYHVSRDEGRYICYFGSIDRDLNPAQKKLLLGGYIRSTVIDGLLTDTNNVLMEFEYTDTYSRIGLCNIYKGHLRKREKLFRGSILGYLTDLNGVLRFVRVYSHKNTKGFPDIYYRNDKNSSWEKFETKANYGYHDITPDGKKLYVSTYDKPDTNSIKNTRCLYVYDIKKDTLEYAIFCDSIFDFHGEPVFLANPYNPASFSLKGITTWKDTAITIWFDKNMERIQKAVDSIIPNSRNYIYNADTSMNRFLFTSYSDRKPSEYYIYEVKTNTARLLFKSSPWINPEQMGKTKVITFTTRDSLPLHGYCTLPVGGNAPYPTVVLLHGGPHLRDYWGFDPTVQLLASRGYAVLQINYRGSEGFGFRISEKEKYDFKKMYCDVFDGTRAVIAQGIADKNRIAIMGASFGGYLAICGVTFEPDLYCCAISEVGVFDWKRQLRSKLLNYNNYVYDYYKPYVGSNEYLDSISPIHWVKNIKAPVFLAGGYEDLTVSSYQSYSLYNKLQLAGVKVEIFIRGGEGHGFFNQKNITEYNKRVVQFLDKYMNN